MYGNDAARLAHPARGGVAETKGPRPDLRIRRGAVNLPIDGAADTYRSVWGRPEKDGTTTAEGGDTFIMFVTWDRAGQLHSESIHQFGSVTLDAKSPHYADQTPLFVAMKTPQKKTAKTTIDKKLVIRPPEGPL